MATNPPRAHSSEWTIDEDQYRSHPHDPRRQPRPADRAARHDEGEGERAAVRPRRVRSAGRRRRRRPRAASGRERDRHRHRRRDEQGQLPRLRQGPPRRLRGRGWARRRWRRRGRPRSTVPRVLHRLLREVLVSGRAAAPDHLQGPDHATSVTSCCRSTSTTSRQRASRRGSTSPRCSCRRRVRAGSGATSTTTATTSTSSAVAEAMREEYLGDRRRRLHPAGRRPVADRACSPIRRAPWEERVEARQRSTSSRSTTPCATSRPTRSATTRATASTTARASPTSPLAKVGAVHAADQRRRLLVRGRQPAPPARVPGSGRTSSCPTTGC